MCTIVYKYIQSKLYLFIIYLFFSKAYQIACLNVTDTDWKILAREALENFELLIAKKAFVHIKELKYLELITLYEVSLFHIFFKIYIYYKF